VLFRCGGRPEDGGVSRTGTDSSPSRHTPSIEAVAAGQKDLITQAQLLAAGLTSRGIRKRVERGTLHRRHRGVYSLGPAPLSREAQFLAAVLAAGPGSALCRACAAELHGTTRHRAPLIAVLSPRNRSIEGVRVHRYRSLDPRDVTTHKGIPVTTIHRTFVDLADETTPQELAAHLHEAAFLGRLVEPAIRDAMHRAKGRRNLRVLEEALAIHAAGGAGFKSRAERAYHVLMRDTEPLVNMKLLGFEVDFRWPEQRLVVEVDGPGHQRPRAKRDDAARDRILRAAGYRVLRFTDEDVYERPDAVRRRTVAALASNPGRRRAA
jgi:very-short-patch-repair endonuclease